MHHVKTHATRTPIVQNLNIYNSHTQCVNERSSPVANCIGTEAFGCHALYHSFIRSIVRFQQCGNAQFVFCSSSLMANVLFGCFHFSFVCLFVADFFCRHFHFQKKCVIKLKVAAYFLDQCKMTAATKETATMINSMMKCVS